MGTHALAVNTCQSGEGSSGCFLYRGSVVTWPVHLGPTLGNRGASARLVDEGVGRERREIGSRGGRREVGQARRGGGMRGARCGEMWGQPAPDLAKVE